MFTKSPVAIGWIIIFLAVPAAFLIWELAHCTYNSPGRHVEHLLFLLVFARGLFELYGYLKTTKQANEA